MTCRGGSRIFSGGREGRFSKKNQKICRPFSFFFKSTKFIFWALPNLYKDPILTKFTAPQANFWKNRPKKAFLGTFWKILTKKLRLFGARSPLKISAFRKYLGSVSQKWTSQMVQRGSFGSAGGRIPEVRGIQLPPPLRPPLLNPPVGTNLTLISVFVVGHLRKMTWLNWWHTKIYWLVQLKVIFKQLKLNQSKPNLLYF